MWKKLCISYRNYVEDMIGILGWITLFHLIFHLRLNYCSLMRGVLKVRRDNKKQKECHIPMWLENGKTHACKCIHRNIINSYNWNSE